MGKSFHLFRYGCSSDNDPVVIAHRGASAYYPENTQPALIGAIDLGADMVEFDVQLTADKEVVVFHDEKISRCTDGSGKISDYTLAQLKKFDAGSWFNKKFRNTRILTLTEALDICRNKIAVNIEIKAEAVNRMFFGGIEEKCLKTVAQAGMTNHAVFSSFEPRAIMHLKEIDGNAPVAVLFEKKHYDDQLPSQIVKLLGADAFNCSPSQLGKKWLEDLRAHDLPVNVYTVDSPKIMRRLLGQGVSGIFTNKPDVLKKVIEEWRQQEKRK
ncbi:MAG TPA: glycerophosphodiester phosphodiesterase family protein [Smithella sp.]|nr:glycerophosphodiester phosphodiesterase family protein [Smithella sp.]HRS96554.1 glycerophosphodiester phosphodiesterase family protein [Smithella sp.]